MEYTGRIAHVDIDTAVEAVARVDGMGLAQDEFNALVEYVVKSGVAAFESSELASCLSIHDTLGVVRELEAAGTPYALRAAKLVSVRMDQPRNPVGE